MDLSYCLYYKNNETTGIWDESDPLNDCTCDISQIRFSTHADLVSAGVVRAV